METDNAKIMDYLWGCVEENEECRELGYHKNRAFIEGVLSRYLFNLNYVQGDEYTEADAKDDAIESELRFWNEMNMEY